MSKTVLLDYPAIKSTKRLLNSERNRCFQKSLTEESGKLIFENKNFLKNQIYPTLNRKSEMK